jgi:hypothetical protein
MRVRPAVPEEDRPEVRLPTSPGRRIHPRPSYSEVPDRPAWAIAVGIASSIVAVGAELLAVLMASISVAARDAPEAMASVFFGMGAVVFGLIAIPFAGLATGAWGLAGAPRVALASGILTVLVAAGNGIFWRASFTIDLR